MNTRNPRYNARGSVDCEIEHPVLGWIPFTAAADDIEPHGRALFAALAAAAAPFDQASIPPPDLATLRARASLSRMEFMLALDAAGLLDDAEAFVAAPSTPRPARIMWANASAFERTHPTLAEMAAAMGISDTQLDAIFNIGA